MRYFMASFKLDDKKLAIDIDVNELNAAQVRLIKSVNSMMAKLLTTKDESAFFNDSAELMRICASLIKQCNFAEEFKMNGIPYAEQALEYSMDLVQERMHGQKVVTYDN